MAANEPGQPGMTEVGVTSIDLPTPRIARSVMTDVPPRNRRSPWYAANARVSFLGPCVARSVRVASGKAAPRRRDDLENAS